MITRAFNYYKDKNEVIIPITVNFIPESLNIQVIDSYKVDSKRDIKYLINEILATPEYIEMYHLGYKRSKHSLISEWAAHNLLYKFNYKRDRVKDVDLNQGESKKRKFLYSILSIFYR